MNTPASRLLLAPLLAVAGALVGCGPPMGHFHAELYGPPTSLPEDQERVPGQHELSFQVRVYTDDDACPDVREWKLTLNGAPTYVLFGDSGRQRENWLFGNCELLLLGAPDPGDGTIEIAGEDGDGHPFRFRWEAVMPRCVSGCGPVLHPGDTVWFAAGDGAPLQQTFSATPGAGYDLVTRTSVRLPEAASVVAGSAELSPEGFHFDVGALSVNGPTPVTFEVPVSIRFPTVTCEGFTCPPELYTQLWRRATLDATYDPAPR